MESLNTNSEEPITQQTHFIGPDGYTFTVNPAPQEQVHSLASPAGEPSAPTEATQQTTAVAAHNTGGLTERIPLWKTAAATAVAVGSAYAIQRGVNHEAVRAQGEHVVSRTADAGSVAFLGLRRAAANLRLRRAGRSAAANIARIGKMEKDADYYKKAAHLTNLSAHRNEANTYGYVEIPTHTREEYTQYRVAQEAGAIERNRRSSHIQGFVPEPTPLQNFLVSEMGMTLSDLTKKQDLAEFQSNPGQATRRETGWRKIKEKLEQDFQQQRLTNSKERETNTATQKAIGAEIKELTKNTRPKNGRQERAGLRNSLRNDAVSKRRHESLAKLRLYQGDRLVKQGIDQFDLSDPEHVEEMIRTGRYTRAQAKALRKASEEAVHHEHSAHRIQGRLDGAEAGEDKVGTVLGYRISDNNNRAARRLRRADTQARRVAEFDDRIAQKRADKVQKRQEKADRKVAKKAVKAQRKARRNNP